jgi:cytochrome c oxidase subunit 2
MKKIYIISIIGIILILGVYFSLNNKESNEKISNDEDFREINIEAYKFGYSPEVISIKQGEKIRLVIDNTDTLHGIRIPDLNLKGNEVIEFTADEIGEFDWYCTNFCGDGHREMGGKIIIE